MRSQVSHRKWLFVAAITLASIPALAACSLPRKTDIVQPPTDDSPPTLPSYTLVTDPYLGQTPPGRAPEVFAPGIVSTDQYEFSCCWSPDGAEFYFTRRGPGSGNNRIMVTTWQEDGWTEPSIAPIAGDYRGWEPTMPPDGRRLYFQSSRLVTGQAQPGMDIWFTERTDDGWSEPTHLGSPFNPQKAMFMSFASDGTAYTTDISQGPGTERLVRSRLVGGVYQDYEYLPPPVNSSERDLYPFVAPDESYVIFTSFRRPGQDAGLYISFRSDSGEWSKPQPIATGLFRSGLPWVSPDGQFLFFSAEGDIYWISMIIIHELGTGDSSQN